MLALKLFLVPGFLLLVSLAARRWGPAMGGWLAGLPIVTGPILAFIAIEQGAGFAAQAAGGSLMAVVSTVAVTVAYAHAARAAHWPVAVAAALATWMIVAWGLSLLPESLALSALLAGASWLLAPRLFPPAVESGPAPPSDPRELALRMIAGALLSLVVTQAASHAGPRWSGLLAVFPMMSIVLAGFSHRTQGPAYTATLLRGLARGLLSFAAFCAVAALLLPTAGTAAGFAAAVLAAMLAQLATLRRQPRS